MKTYGVRLFLIILSLLLVSNLVLLESRANSSVNDKNRHSFKKKDKTDASTFARAPVFFEENKGQSDASILFLSRNVGYTLFLTATEVVYQIQNSNCGARNGKSKNSFDRFKARTLKPKPCSTATLGMKFFGSNDDVKIEGADLLPTKTNYFIGSDESRWLRGVSSFQSVRYRQIYAGIDAVFRGIEDQNLEYDFHVASNADPDLIRLEFAGATKLKINRSGELVLKYQGGEIRHRQPVAYQIINGEKKFISARFVLLERNLVGFALSEYDRNFELTIDPIVYATYLGGFYQDYATDVALDSSGNIYVASSVTSGDFLHTEPPGARRLDGDIAVTKFNSSGSTVLYNTHIGGFKSEYAWAIDVDANGNAFIGGQTRSPNFPMVNARQTANSTNGGDSIEGFVAKLNAAGMIQYSTYHGSPTSADDWVSSLNVDSFGNVYMSGRTNGSDFPLINAYQNVLKGDHDGCLSKFSPTGELLYSTFFGGGCSNCSHSNSYAYDVAVDDQGNAFIAGETFSTQLPITSGAYQTSGDGFVAKFDTTKTGSQSLVYATYIPSVGSAIANDAAGNVYVASVIPYGPTGNSIIKLNATGTAALYSYPLTEQRFDIVDIAVDSNGRAYFAQDFSSLNYHIEVKSLTSDGRLIGKVPINDVWLANGIAVDSGGYVYVAGATYVYRSFPATPDAYQRQNRGGVPSPIQGFLAKVLVEPEKNPLIFVPGTMGSELYRKNANGSVGEKYWARWGNGLLYHPYLTLDEQSSYFLGADALEARDVLRRVRYEGINPIILPIEIPITIGTGYVLPTIYEDLLTNIASHGRYELNAQQNPTLRNPDGSCDFSQKSGNPGERPNLFVFPYDFRKSNAVSAERLKDFIQCVQQFYPDKKVDILAHSQGGLASRRYILDSARNGQNNNVDKLITIASPWLGAPEALYKVETGGDYLPDGLNGGLVIQLGFSIGLLQPPLIKSLSEFFPSVHELLPTRDYQALSGAPSLREIGDMNGDGIPNDPYSYEQTITFLNQDFARSKPGKNSADFHDCVTVPTAYGQDDWRSDQSGVKYHHIVATKLGETTTTSVTVEEFEFCTSGAREGMRACRRQRIFRPIKGAGDGTVPTVSAGRGYVNQTNPGLNYQDARVEYLDSPSPNVNDDYDHNGVTKNCRAWNLVLMWLGAVSQTCQTNLTNQANSSELLEASYSQASSTTGAEAYYIKIIGVPEVDVSDQAGNKLLKGNGFTVNGVKGLEEYKVIGENALFLTIFPTQNHYIDFLVGNNPIVLEAVKGIGNARPNLAVRFNDLSLPAGVKARLTLTPDGVVSLRYDSDGDGNFETTVNPTVVLNGTQANDTEAPILSINFTQQGNSVKIEITGQDAASGMRNISYSLDGVNFGNYSAPIILSYSPNPIKIYAFADDNAANRSGLYTKEFRFLDVTPPTTSAGYELNGQQAIVTLTSSDELSGVESITYSVDGGASQTYSSPYAVSGSGNHTVTYFARDRAGNVETPKTLTFLIPVVNPIVTITAPSSGSIYPVGTQVSFIGNFSDDGCNTHTAVWTFDNVSQTGSINETSRTVQANYTFTSAGVYLVLLTVNNNCGGTGSANTVDELTAMVVVYDPNGGFVTGGGWINSAVGAYPANPNLTGRASFGFTSKYQPGATVPSGNTEFQFRLANFNFKSTAYDWLIVAGARAQYKGSGTVNNSGDYGFLLTAIDGQINGGGGTDKFRIKIWDRNTNLIIYDNQIGAPDGTDPTTIIGGGSVVIHRQ